MPDDEEKSEQFQGMGAHMLLHTCLMMRKKLAAEAKYKQTVPPATSGRLVAPLNPDEEIFARVPHV